MSLTLNFDSFHCDLLRHQHLLSNSKEVIGTYHDHLLHLLDFPYNGETRPQYLLGDGEITQNKHHLYVICFRLRTFPLIFELSVRNHGGIPKIDPDTFEIEIGGLVNKPIKIALKDLMNPDLFP